MGPEEPDLALYSGYPIPPDSMRRKLTRDLFFISGYKNMAGLGRAVRDEEPRGAVHRRGAGGAVRHLHRGRAVVGVPGDLGRAVDDALEVQQPAARDRRARGDDAIEGPAAHHARRAPDPPRPPDVRALQHGLAPRAPRRHGRAVAPPSPSARRARPLGLGDRGDHVPDLSRAVEAARVGCAASVVKTASAS